MSDDTHTYPAKSRAQGVCPNCQHTLHDVLPLDPVFSLETAAALIPCARRTLEPWLKKLKPILGIPLYKKDVHKRRYRYLRGWEIQLLRDNMFFTRSPDGTFSQVINLFDTAQGVWLDEHEKSTPSS